MKIIEEVGDFVGWVLFAPRPEIKMVALAVGLKAFFTKE